MLNPHFVHLRLHSEYSIVDGMVRINDAIAVSVADKQGALALTDLSNLFGLIRFYKAARKFGLKPIAGCDIWIRNQNEPDSLSRLLLLVKDRQGYLNLCKLLSRAWLHRQYDGRAEVDSSWFSEGLGNGLIALSSAEFGNIGIALARGQVDMAKKYAQSWAALFPKRFYIEVQRTSLSGSESLLRHSVALAMELGLPIVATHPIQFMKREDFTAHEARVCISEGDRLARPGRDRRFSEDQFFRTQSEMLEIFSDLPSALENSVEIAKRCNLILELGCPKLPQFPTPDGSSLESYLVTQASKGLEKRLIKKLHTEQISKHMQKSIYLDRLEFEMNIIKGMGFAGYFLIVADFVNWAKQNDVRVGPGRGSGASSLVAYALGITDLDPLQYNLLFERFLNPERVSMPDFDIDFCQDGRDKVIQYVKCKYGVEAVSQIATFGSMAAKASIRDVGRVLDLGYNFTDAIAKLIPFKPGKHVTINDAIKEEPLLAERYKNEEEVHMLLNLAQRVEGLTRSVGMHAGGVLIAPGKLTDFCPLYMQSQEKNVVSQYDKDDVESIGLVKFDFLGLTTLTILDWTERYIHQLDQKKINWKLSDVPLDDLKAFSILKNTNTVAVFQLESRGMQGMLKDASPDRFEDIIALVSLYRPGPMDLIPSFCARKHGKEKIEYPDPRVEPILKETYGIMVYQEQVMQMAQIIGGYSLGKADLLRRAMGKKKVDEMAKHRQIFRMGAAKNGLKVDKADEIFNLMEKFAGYGFNKSHAAAYALLAYYTAWLKAYYPEEFMAANMSLAMNDTDRMKILFNDCKVNNIEILGPDINVSVYRFEPVLHDANNSFSKKIRYGLGAIKGSGQSAIEEILRARIQGNFKDFFEFCARVDRTIVNRRVIEALIRAGAFDKLNEERASLLASLSFALEAAEQASANPLQVGLFDTVEVDYKQSYKLVSVTPWSKKQKLKEEKSAIGFFLSGHMFDDYYSEVRKFVKQPIAELQEGRNKIVAGIIVSMRIKMTKLGKMAIVLLDDGTAQIQVSVFNDIFDTNRHFFKEDELLIASGQVRCDNFLGGIKFTAETVMNLEAARRRFAYAVLLRINSEVDLRKLGDVLVCYRNKTRKDKFDIHRKIREKNLSSNDNSLELGLPAHIFYIGKKAKAEIVLGDDWKLEPSENLLSELKKIPSVESACISYGEICIEDLEKNTMYFK